MSGWRNDYMLVPESILEVQNFERGPMSKETLGIGLEATINEFMEEHSGEQPGSWVYDILDNSNLELDTETRKKWAQFLITMPKKYATEADENLYYVLKQNNIEWIPYLPIMGNDFGYTVEGDKYYLHFGAWLDFRDLFDSQSRDVSLEFIGDVLCGEDSYEHFERDMEEYEDITQSGWYLSKTVEKGNVPALEDLKTTAIEMGASPENVTSLDDLLN